MLPLNLPDGTFSTIAAFLAEIGLPVHTREIPDATFLPGVQAESGILWVDPSRLSYPGDLLHEAGHLALLPEAERKQVCGDMGDSGGYEMGAIAWSYAAAVHLQLDPAIVFHEHGYRGGGRDMIRNFSTGCYIGLPMLQWLGLALDARSALKLGLKPYPNMLRWLRV